MSVIKDGRYPIILDKVRHLLFSLNAMAELEDKTGGYDKLNETMSNTKTLRWLLTLLINEGADDADEPLTEKQVGKLIHTGNITEVKDAIFKTFAIGINGGKEPESGEEDDDSEKNLKSGQSR